MLARWKERQLSKEEAHMDPGKKKPGRVKEWPAPNALKQENAVLEELCSKPGVNCTIDGRTYIIAQGNTDGADYVH
jgi:hypothetical protein